MIPVAGKSQLVAEIRDEEKFQTTFAMVSFESSGITWQKQFQEKWWISAVSARNDLVLLQSFEGSGNPARKDLLAIDAATGQVRWTAGKFSLYAWAPDGMLLGYVGGGSELKQAYLSIADGKVLEKEWPAGPEAASEEVFNPVTYLEGSDNFDKVQSFVNRHYPVQIALGAEYLEFGNYIGISYYVREGDFLANYLLVTDREGQLELKDTLGKNLQGLGTHTFFALPDCLIFVKNRCELVRYSMYD